ncbi:hypothetical protein ES705_15609 [subsurface metagenome]
MINKSLHFSEWYTKVVHTFFSGNQGYRVHVLSVYQGWYTKVAHTFFSGDLGYRACVPLILYIYILIKGIYIMIHNNVLRVYKSLERVVHRGHMAETLAIIDKSVAKGVYQGWYTLAHVVHSKILQE